MTGFEELEEQCLEDLQLDYTPLQDIVRIFSGHDKLLPSEDEFLEALNFLKYMIDKYDITSYAGPGGTIITDSSAKQMEFFKLSWYAGKYDEICYDYWFLKD